MKTFELTLVELNRLLNELKEMSDGTKSNKGTIELEEIIKKTKNLIKLKRIENLTEQINSIENEIMDMDYSFYDIKNPKIEKYFNMRRQSLIEYKKSCNDEIEYLLEK